MGVEQPDAFGALLDDGPVALLALFERLLRLSALGDVARHSADRRLPRVRDHRRARLHEQHRAVLPAVPPLAYVATLLLEAAPDVRVDVLLLVVDEVVDAHT